MSTPFRTSSALCTPIPATAASHTHAESAAVLGMWRDRGVTALPVGVTTVLTDVRPDARGVDVTVPAHSDHNSTIKPMGAFPATAGSAYAAKQAAPPRGRYR